ncbi:uncharacterized protein B0I36DRAFT_31382 [Microdochium trichocladiopsis]|uniref:Uncharacterized protein n=1 Tax=Microdochium trichocladiopsis TaxID=1682393 RepID=A0A9P8XW87_9PEZI|nr:uncharacterized protein B0I36DRAFT_31382 [Microdochium trichocladiopsis]KAH7021333.1 hypothetical protein B0I36DRAFT_31382 [Microdochium trichocladiopsis]
MCPSSSHGPQWSRHRRAALSRTPREQRSQSLRHHQMDTQREHTGQQRRLALQPHVELSREPHYRVTIDDRVPFGHATNPDDHTQDPLAQDIVAGMSTLHVQDEIYIVTDHEHASPQYHLGHSVSERGNAMPPSPLAGSDGDPGELSQRGLENHSMQQWIIQERADEPWVLLERNSPMSVPDVAEVPSSDRRHALDDWTTPRTLFTTDENCLLPDELEQFCGRPWLSSHHYSTWHSPSPDDHGSGDSGLAP